MVCDKDNVGSAKSIRNNGGILENEIVVDGVVEQRYWIELAYVWGLRQMERYTGLSTVEKKFAVILWKYCLEGHVDKDFGRG